jgi:hypothetical protein
VTRLLLALFVALALIATSCGGRGTNTVTVAGTSTPSTTTGAASTQSEKPETPEQIIAALKSAGLPIGAVRSYTASTDPNKLLGRPGQYTGKANFRDRRLVEQERRLAREDGRFRTATEALAAGLARDFAMSWMFG